MILYLSGPITGNPDYKTMFADAADQLREQGFTVINPALNPAGLTPADYMRISLAQLEAADAIVLLGAWALSRGAVIEGLFAAYASKQLFVADKDPFTGRPSIMPVSGRWLQDVVATGIVMKLQEEGKAG